MNNIQLRSAFILVSVLALVGVACGPKATQKKTGAKTPPAATAVTSKATKNPPATKPTTTKSQTLPTTSPADGGGDDAPACTAADVGKCGCLGDAAFQDDSGVVYDMVCCDAEGDNISLYACGDGFTCDDSTDTISCKANQ